MAAKCAGAMKPLTHWNLLILYDIVRLICLLITRANGGNADSGCACQLFIGLGFPYEGPAPLEAIAQGCVFINPRFSPPHSALNTKFFSGKPTRRQVSSSLMA